MRTKRLAWNQSTSAILAFAALGAFATASLLNGSSISFVMQHSFLTLAPWVLTGFLLGMGWLPFVERAAYSRPVYTYVRVTRR